MQPKILFIPGFMLLAGLNACKNSNVTAAGAGKGKADMMLVKGIILQAQSINNNITATGTLLPNEQVELKCEISARIIKIAFTEGTHVKKGDLLVKLFDSDLQAQQEKLELQKKLAEEKEYRERNLLQKGAVSQEEYDNVSNQLNGLKADLSLVKSQLEKTEIRAPFNGVVGLRYVSEGAYAMPTQKIATIVNDDKIKIEFAVPEKYADYMKKGTVVTFLNKTRKGLSKAVVYATEPQIDPTTRSLQLRAIADNSEGLIPGTFVEITLNIGNISNKGIAIPTEAVVPELKGQKVYLYHNGKAASQKISTGVRNDVLVEVTDGLKVGDTLITKGIIKLRENMPVKWSTL